MIPVVQKLLELESDACEKVRVILTDCSHAFINAWNAVNGLGVLHLCCAWHLERAWTKNIREEGLLQALKKLRQQSNEAKFLNLHQKAKKKWVRAFYNKTRLTA